METNTGVSWEYILPDIVDADNDSVTLTKDFSAASFVSLVGTEKITITDVSTIRKGAY